MAVPAAEFRSMSPPTYVVDNHPTDIRFYCWSDNPFCPSEEVDDIDGISASNTLGVENQQPVNETMLNHLRTLFQQSQGVDHSFPSPSPAIGVTDVTLG
jgi:hypothetical protein